ncbi:hypothetical protein [Alteribacillus sp. HJP-4]|uniref:hypothetical protein n=1 Tax=Alteribacillus sp. HJP-4 TaxID=2775394 RepID=UPI0035CCD461
MRRKLSWLLAAARKEMLLFAAGVFGLVLASGLAVYMYFFGTIVLPEGNIRSAFSFNAAVGIFMLSIAVLLPLAGMKERSRKRVRRMLFTAAIISFAIETVQHLRGFNPRFSQAGSIFDMAVGMFFGLVTLVIIFAAAWVTIAFFQNKERGERRPLILTIRYAFVSVLIANAAGIWMIILQGRATGEAGNIIVLHGLGYHALQALPVIGFLLMKSSAEMTTSARKIVHIAGSSWVTLLLLILIQTAIGHSVFELSPLSIAAGLFSLSWFATLVWAFLKYFHSQIPIIESKPRVP